MSHTAAIESEMHSLTARLRKARQGLSSGSIIDLTPIEQDVKGLCQAVERLAPEESRSLRPRWAESRGSRPLHHVARPAADAGRQ